MPTKSMSPTPGSTADRVSDRPGRFAAHGRQLGYFFLGSLAGVSIDLLVFRLLTFLDVYPAIANMVSSSLAITVTYLLVTRFAFGAQPRVRTYAIFFAWYALSITAFSLAIQITAQETRLDEFASKVVSLPFSFLVNFLATKIILRKKTMRPSPGHPARRKPLTWASIYRIAPLVVAWIALLVAGGLLYFRVQLNSDTLFLDNLAQDLFRDGGGWWDWSLTPAAAYFPDMGLYFVAYFTLPTALLRIFAVSFVQVILLGLAAMFVVRRLAGRSNWYAQAVGICVVAVITLLCARSDLWLYFYSTNNHFAAILLPLIVVGLTISFLQQGRWVPLIGIVVCGVLGQVSTSVYLLVLVLPLIVSLALVWLVSLAFDVGSRTIRRRLTLIVAAVVVGSLISLIVIRIVTPGDPSAGRYGLSFDLLERGSSAMVAIAEYLFTGAGRDVLLFMAAVVGCVVYLAVSGFFALRRRIRTDPLTGQASVSFRWLSSRSESGARALAVWFAAWSLAIAVVGGFISGGVQDKHGYRYFELPVILLMLIASVHILGRIRSRNVALAVTALAVVSTLTLTAVSVQSSVERAARNEFARGTAECLDHIQSDGTDLRAGIADYWYARGTALQLSEPASIVAVWGDSLIPFEWMSTSDPIDEPTTEYNFAIVHPESSPPWNVDESTISPLLPVPSRVFSCPTGVEVWTWSDASLDKTIRVTFDEWISQRRP